MHVILLKDIQGIGTKNQVKEVRDGHARNFLIPKGLAKAATAGELKVHGHAMAQNAEHEEALMDKLRKLATALKGMKFNFYLKTDGQGSVFGSINKEAILKTLRGEGGVSPERVDIHLDHPIKEFGEHQIPVEFQRGIKSSVIANVQPQP